MLILTAPACGSGCCARTGRAYNKATAHSNSGTASDPAYLGLTSRSSCTSCAKQGPEGLKHLHLRNPIGTPTIRAERWPAGSSAISDDPMSPFFRNDAEFPPPEPADLLEIGRPPVLAAESHPPAICTNLSLEFSKRRDKFAFTTPRPARACSFDFAIF